MSVEIGSLVVRGSFGRRRNEEAAPVSEERLSDILAGLRREMRDEVARAAERLERRLRES